MLTGLGNPDGVARGADGAFYVSNNSAGRVLRAVPGSAPTDLGRAGDAAANLEFGAGVLPCDRLYVTSSGNLAILDVATTGAPVPWR